MGSGGGSSNTRTYDPVYNERMAAIADRQQAQADEYFNFWKTQYKPMEEAQIKANIGLMPQEIETRKATLSAEKAAAEQAMTLLPAQTDYQLGVMEANKKEIGAASPVMAEFYKQALIGKDVNQEVAKARADVASQFEEGDAEAMRTAGRYGITSGRALDALKSTNIDKSKAAAYAMTTTRGVTQESNFARLGGAMSTYKGGLLKT